MITLTGSSNQVFDYIISFFAELCLVYKMSVLSLLKVTPNHKSRDTSDGDNYVWHIANRVGNNTYVCLYTVDKLHRHSASLKCVNRTGTKFTEKCPARATVTFREDIWPFIQVIKQKKYKPKYGFVGGADVITCIDNYETQLHTHKSYCQASSDPSVHCRITKHVLSCYSETEVENTAYPRLFRHEVITEAKLEPVSWYQVQISFNLKVPSLRIFHKHRCLEYTGRTDKQPAIKF